MKLQTWMLIDGEIFRDGSCVGYLTQMSIGFSSLLATHTTSISASAETATPKSPSIFSLQWTAAKLAIFRKLSGNWPTGKIQGYPVVIKHGNGQFPIHRCFFPLQPPFIADVQFPCLVTPEATMTRACLVHVHLRPPVINVSSSASDGVSVTLPTPENWEGTRLQSQNRWESAK